MKQDQSQSTKKRATYGFDRKLVAKDARGSETCFEMERARLGFYNLSKRSNFNLLSCRGGADSFYARGDSLDYNVLHKCDTESALEEILNGRAQSFTRNTIHCHVDQPLPRCLSKVTKKGGTVKIDGMDCNVKYKLGSGSYGTVFLCESNEDERFALKVQRPPHLGCLAWEFRVMEKLKRRLSTHSREGDVYEFPTARSISVFSDGAALQMTAGSHSGLNLLDVVNFHKGNIPELIAIHYTHRMLCHLETLHLTGKFLVSLVLSNCW